MTKNIEKNTEKNAENTTQISTQISTQKTIEKNIDKLIYNETATKEKKRIALSSVFAALFLTTIKIVVGVFTGSLGVLAEALHSGLDLVAAVVTWMAVRASGKPADKQHHYGHGKIENLSALFETLLLVITCFWIVYEAIERLFFKEVMVRNSYWSFLVIIISIGVDYSRSRALMRVARKYDSQALEADALHFSTDIWSSLVVLFGLILVYLAEQLKLPILVKADAVAALGVAGVVLWVSWSLGLKAINDLLDTAPQGMREDIEKIVSGIQGVNRVSRIRLRKAGSEVFSDITVEVSPHLSFEMGQELSNQIKNELKKKNSHADVLVSLEAQEVINDQMTAKIHLLAARFGMGVHGIRVYEIHEYPEPLEKSIEMHLEVNNKMSLREANIKSQAFKEKLKVFLPHFSQISLHLEPDGDEVLIRRARLISCEQIPKSIQKVMQDLKMDHKIENIVCREVEEVVCVSFVLIFNGNPNISEAHSLSEKIEMGMREELPLLGRILIDMKPN